MVEIYEMAKESAFSISFSTSSICFDIYNYVPTAKEIWKRLESKYMQKDATSKKFIISHFNNYKMHDSRPVEQLHELKKFLIILYNIICIRMSLLLCLTL